MFVYLDEQQCWAMKFKFPIFTCGSCLTPPTVPLVGIDIVVGSSKHITGEGSGLHIPSSPHIELLFDGTNPDC